MTGPKLASVPGAVTKFAVTGLAALVLLVGAGMFMFDQIAEDQAVANAREFAQLAARGAVEPYLTDEAVAGDPAALAKLDEVIRDRVLQGSVVRVKIWDRDGRVVYSDEPSLIGERYPLAEEDVEALDTGAVDAEVSDVTAPENRFERPLGKLLEVYAPVRTPSGEVLLFELYQRYSTVTATAREAWMKFGLVALAGLVVLWLVQLPLALGLARRLRAGQEERELLLLRAIDASDAERRRIASDLHDGVVQDLAGLAFSLSAAADRAKGRGSAESGQQLDRAAGSVRRAVRQMRSLLVDIYPPNLHTVGLEAALRDLLSPLQAQGISSELEVDPGLNLAPATERLLFVTAREALRNVARHSDAQSAAVSVRAGADRVELRVDDDGCGFSADEVLARTPNGHLGLALLADLAQRAGGDLAVDSSEGGGTRLRLEVPAG